MSELIKSINRLSARIETEALQQKTIDSIKRRIRKKMRIIKLHKDQKGKCSICGLPISLNAEQYHRYSPSIDHIKPKSMFGVGILNNTALAHRYCNLRKGNRESFTVYWKTDRFIRECLEYFNDRESKK